MNAKFDCYVTTIAEQEKSLQYDGKSHPATLFGFVTKVNHKSLCIIVLRKRVSNDRNCKLKCQAHNYF